MANQIGKNLYSPAVAAAMPTLSPSWKHYAAIVEDSRVKVGLRSDTAKLKEAVLPVFRHEAMPVSTRKQKKEAHGEVYWSPRFVDFYSFDEEYLRRLGAHDAATEAHFIAYFTERLKMVLRARGVDSPTVDDICQETFCRVWVAVQAGAVNNPRGFGAYVHSVCRNVLSENRRGDRRHQHESIETHDVPDEHLNLDERMQRKETDNLVRAVLSELPERDRNILHARFFEERDNDEVCQDFRVDRDYLRVLLHRAVNKFGDIYKKRSN